MLLGLVLGFVGGVFGSLGVQGGVAYFKRRARQARDLVEDARDLGRAVRDEFRN